MRGPALTTTGTATSSSKNGGAASSAAAAATATTGAAGAVGNSKKKFGKNLNKLVNRPAAPPIVDRMGAGGLHGSSRNGLLLLSKSKTAAGSGGAAAVNAGGAGGAAAASTAGATAATASNGLLAKSTATASSSSSSLLLSNSASAKGVPDAWGGAAAASATTSSSNTDAAAPSTVPSAPTPRQDSVVKVERDDVPVQDGPAWDEYGGRGSGPYYGNVPTAGGRRLLDVDAPSSSSGGDAQADAMSRLARDKAEQKRREEAARIQEQQAKAALRLRDLDLRRGGATGASSSSVDAAGVITTPPPPSLPHPRWDATRSGTKELWEPDQQQSNSRRGMDRRSRSNSGGGDGHHHSPRANPSSAAASAAGAGPPLIHLNSFDDRDRGEPARAAGSAPRMLFDPKSGSMVAVKAKDEHHHHHGPSHAAGSTTTSSAANASKKKASRSAATTKSARSGGKDVSTRGDSPNDVTKIVRSSNIGTVSIATKPKKDGASASSTTTPGDAKTKGSGAAARRLPRTCGVLYQRDDKGNCYCADDCDGDLGYGSHSVPGGRARNPDAYAAFLNEHYRRRGVAIPPGGAAGEYDAQQQLHYDMYGGADENNYDAGDGSGVALYTGFNPEGEFVPPEPIEYVRADDKLELVTGVDDSPSLKPTAKEFAPSQAALAAARAAAESKKDASLIESSEDEDEGFDDMVDDDDDDVDGPLGLGFDPTIDMDFVMQSPSHDDDRKRVESLAISALDLEPTAFTSSDEAGLGGGPRHIFAFGTSGTWGVTHPSSTSSSLIGGDWKVSDVNDVNALFGSHAFRVGVGGNDGIAANEDDEPNSLTTAAAGMASSTTSSVASFLNIPASSSWGSPTTTTTLGGGGLTNVAAAPGSAD